MKVQRFRKIEKEDEPIIKQLFNDGYGASTIAIKLGMRQGTVDNYLRAVGLRRTRKEAFKAMVERGKVENTIC